MKVPGILMQINCGSCGFQKTFQLGVTLAQFETLEEYVAARHLKRRPEPSLKSTISEWVCHSSFECPHCNLLYEVTSRSETDEEGSALLRPVRSRCPRCHAKGREVDEFTEDIGALPCPVCCSHSLHRQDVALWD